MHTTEIAKTKTSLHGTIFVFMGIDANDKMVWLTIDTYHGNDSYNDCTIILSLFKYVFNIFDFSKAYVIYDR